MSEKNLYYLHELSNYKVDSDYPDVRGWKLKDAANRTIGTVDNLLVNKKEKRVVYLDVELDEEITGKEHQQLQSSDSGGVHEFRNKDGENHLIVPIGLVDIDEDNKHVLSNEISYDTFSNAQRFRKGDTIDQDYELTVYRHYVPANTTGNSDTLQDDFYNHNAFKSKYKNP